jgi:hypothetical protein
MKIKHGTYLIYANILNDGFEVFTPVVMKSLVFWDITLFVLSASSSFLVWLILRA